MLKKQSQQSEHRVASIVNKPALMSLVYLNSLSIRVTCTCFAPRPTSSLLLGSTITVHFNWAVPGQLVARARSERPCDNSTSSALSQVERRAQVHIVSNTYWASLVIACSRGTYLYAPMPYQ